MGGVIEHIGSSLIDGHRAGAGGGVGLLLANMKLKGFKMQFMFRHDRFLTIHRFFLAHPLRGRLCGKTKEMPGTALATVPGRDSQQHPGVTFGPTAVPKTPRPDERPGCGAFAHSGNWRAERYSRLSSFCPPSLICFRALNILNCLVCVDYTSVFSDCQPLFSFFLQKKSAARRPRKGAGTRRP